MNRNTERLAQHNGNEPEHRKISTTETSPNTTKLAHHNGNKMQHNKICKNIYFSKNIWLNSSYHTISSRCLIWSWQNANGP